MNDAIRATLRLSALAAGLILAACDSGKDTMMVGTLERYRIELRVESNEPIVAIHVEDGRSVAAGDPVLDQDPVRMEARLARQQALAEQAAARLAELERGPRQETIREARARLDAAQVRKANAEADYRRTKDVFDKGLSTRSGLDQAETEWKASIAETKAVGEALDRLVNGTTVEELQQAAAKLRAAEAQVRQAAVDLDRTHITAPGAGVIDKVLFRLGERPPAGSTVAVLLDDARTFARVYVPEHLRAGIQPGREITVRIDGTDKDWHGTVRWVSADASFTPYFALTEHDRSRLSYLAEIDLPDAAGLPSGVPLVAIAPGE